MTTFEMTWKRATAVVATLISVGLIAVGVMLIVFQFRSDDGPPPVEPLTLRSWDDKETGKRCYMYGENLLCTDLPVAAEVVEEEEDDDDSFPEDEWYKRVTESL